MTKKLIYLDTYVLQQDRRIRMPKSILENMDAKQGVSKFKIFYDKSKSQIIMQIDKEEKEDKKWK